MNWLKRSPAPSPESDFWYYPVAAGSPTNSGVKVDEWKAVTYLTVFDCVSLISGDVANLPLHLYKRLPNGGKERAQRHPKYDLCHTSPNEDMTARSWIEAGLSHLLLWGNHYAYKVYNRQGQLTAIWPFDNPGNIKVTREKDGRLHYKWRDSNGDEHDKTKDQILHIPGWGFNGITGESPVAIAREAIGLGLANENFAETFFGKGTHPAGILKLPPEARGMEDDVAMKHLANYKNQFSGLGKAHEIVMFRSGEDYIPLTMPLGDAQFLESRQFQKLEIAGMYHVPPHKIAIHGANSNYNNEEQENRHYVDSCLMSWVRRWETCLNQQVLTPRERGSGLFFEFSLEGLLRGDSQARASFYQAMVQNGIMTRNEVRQKENWNPLPDEERADETLVPLNFIFAKDIGVLPEEIPKMKKEERSKLLGWAKLQVEDRSIVARDRIVKNYRKIILSTAQQIVNREIGGVKAVLKKYVELKKIRSQNPDFEKWLDEYYQDMGEYVRKKLGPVFWSFSRMVWDVAIDEVGTDLSDEDFTDFIDEYINVYVVRHTSSSLGQLKSLEIEDVEQRLDEWQEKRSAKIADNESVRLSNGTFAVGVFSAGLSLVLRNRGAKTCPYCKSLEGKVIKKSQPLLNDGEKIEVDGQEPMLIRGAKFHPPIHQGCDCYVAVSR